MTLLRKAGGSSASKGAGHGCHIQLGILVIKLNIQHRTTYCYDRPGVLGDHRLMVRPRETRDLRLISSDLFMTPVPNIKWGEDIFGNAVATASFRQTTDHLLIDAGSELELCTADWPLFDIAISAMRYPLC